MTETVKMIAWGMLDWSNVDPYSPTHREIVRAVAKDVRGRGFRLKEETKPNDRWMGAAHYILYHKRGHQQKRRVSRVEFRGTLPAMCKFFYERFLKLPEEVT